MVSCREYGISEVLPHQEEFAQEVTYDAAKLKRFLLLISFSAWRIDAQSRPRWLRIIITLFIFKQGPPNFVSFPKTYLAAIWSDIELFIWLMLLWHFDNESHILFFFWKFGFGFFFSFLAVYEIFNFIVITFTFLNHFRIALLVFIIFELIEIRAKWNFQFTFTHPLHAA